jgi:hypothetical protein
MAPGVAAAFVLAAATGNLLSGSAMNRRFPHFRLPATLGVALLGPACIAMAATVFVDRKGDDANPGTADRPLRTLHSLSRRNWGPGDAIYFRGGQTFNGTLGLPGGGSDAKPVVVGSFGGGRATIDSSGATLFFGVNQGGFQLQDLNLKSSSSRGKSSGILFYSDSPVGTRFPAVTVKNCDLRGFGDAAIKIGSWNPSNPGWTKIRVENCRVTCNGEGMAVYGFDSPAANPYAHGFLQVANSEFAGNRGTGLSICGVSGGLVDCCSFHDNQRVGGCWTWAARNVVIQRCISYKNRRGGTNDGFGFDLDGGSVGCTIQYCLSYENDTAGFAIFDCPNSADIADNTIRWCISENDVRSDKEGGSFTMNSWANTPIRDSHIHNCVAFLTSRHGRSVCAGFIGIGQRAPYGWQSGSISGCGFWNNIVYLDGGGRDLAHVYSQPGASLPQEISFLGNAYASSKKQPLRIVTGHGRFSSLAEWRAATGQERLSGPNGMMDCGIAADPQCAGVGEFHRVTDPAQMARSTDWRPMAGSPCLKAGLDVERYFRMHPGPLDFYGNPVGKGAAVTIGAAGLQSVLR